MSILDPVRVDDRNSDICYAGGIWSNQGGPNESEGTTKLTRDAGTTATFTFVGTSVAVYGTLPDNKLYGGAIVSTYSLDGGPEKTFSGQTTSVNQYRQQFFRSGTISAGEHKLVIKNVNKDSWYFLDYIEYQPLQSTPDAPPPSQVTPVQNPPAQDTAKNDPTLVPSPTPKTETKVVVVTSQEVVGQSTIQRTLTSTTTSISTPSKSSPSGNSSSFSQSASITAGSISSSGLAGSDSEAGTVDESNASSKSTPIGAIVGGAVGGLVIILVLLFLLLLHRRRKGASITSQPRQTGLVAVPYNVTQDSFNRSSSGETPIYRVISEVRPRTGPSDHLIAGGSLSTMYGSRKDQTTYYSCNNSGTALVSPDRSYTASPSFGAHSGRVGLHRNGPSLSLTSASSQRLSYVSDGVRSGDAYGGIVDQYDSPPDYQTAQTFSQAGLSPIPFNRDVKS
ncbi:hypothetical protein BDQ12DRAFT_737185 [Crucibulum laeve]|uniref:Mid2 domain-containing protein n=1 Tax=Crucibulum laeve TaxID=68775 RepID=A0A5C3LSC2_9AGAR|nr:hypothetical protein BDQ12DRAFT_737185 [Crucibulum laeve]